jgi:hypothetical protein
MTFNFDNLEIESRTEWLPLPEVTPKAKLLVRPATEENPGYYNGFLRALSGKGQRLARAKKLTKEDSEQVREADRKLFPRYVIVNWEGILDTDGNKVPFSRDHVTEFCAKLPGWIFDQVRNFASTPENFLPEDEEPTPDAEEISGN